ncbi:hypothetical protein BGZ99_008877 [Dissophora globulifera]|uniref:Stress-response A/B barrel domain-containing protein n=1 Tax=Dissophora globulifera TaxID=979702 RepID=A0A9P6RVR5_9FUNG|nr:hypothetical protein BGZ99_008877 [Dissophora globulifera]
MTVKHIVLIKLKAGADGERLMKQIEALKDAIPQVQSVQLGVGFSPARDKGFTHGLAMTFKNREDLQIYNVAEAHVNLVKNDLVPVADDLLVFDYDIVEF